MKKSSISGIFGVCALFLTLLSCATGGAVPAVEGLLSLDDALDAAVTAIEARVGKGDEIAVYEIVSFNDGLVIIFAQTLTAGLPSAGNLFLWYVIRQPAMWTASTSSRCPAL